jgi:hypothetical protein
VNGERQLSGHAKPFNQLLGDRRWALAHEHERGVGIEPAESTKQPQLITIETMIARYAALGAPDVDGCGLEVDLLPLQADQLRHPQGGATGRENCWNGWTRYCRSSRAPEARLAVLGLPLHEARHIGFQRPLQPGAWGCGRHTLARERPAYGGPLRGVVGEGMSPSYAASRFLARITVIADQGLPVGVGSLRSFRMRAISRADLPARSS